MVYITAGSTGKCKINDLFEELVFRSREIEFFTRSKVLFLPHVLDIFIGEVVEIGFFRDILPYQFVDVLYS